MTDFNTSVKSFSKQLRESWLVPAVNVGGTEKTMKEVTVRAKYSTSQNKWHLSGGGRERNIYFDDITRTDEENALVHARVFTFDRNYRQTGYKVKNCGDHYMVTITMIPLIK